MKGRFFVYLNFRVVAAGSPGHEWEGKEHESFEDAAVAAKELVVRRDCEAQIFQLVGTAKKDVVIA